MMNDARKVKVKKCLPESRTNKKETFKAIHKSIKRERRCIKRNMRKEKYAS